MMKRVSRAFARYALERVEPFVSRLDAQKELFVLGVQDEDPRLSGSYYFEVLDDARPASGNEARPGLLVGGSQAAKLLALDPNSASGSIATLEEEEGAGRLQVVHTDTGFVFKREGAAGDQNYEIKPHVFRLLQNYIEYTLPHCSHWLTMEVEEKIQIDQLLTDLMVRFYYNRQERIVEQTAAEMRIDDEELDTNEEDDRDDKRSRKPLRREDQSRPETRSTSDSPQRRRAPSTRADTQVDIEIAEERLEKMERAQPQPQSLPKPKAQSKPPKPIASETKAANPYQSLKQRSVETIDAAKPLPSDGTESTESNKNN